MDGCGGKSVIAAAVVMFLTRSVPERVARAWLEVERQRGRGE